MLQYQLLSPVKILHQVLIITPQTYAQNLSQSKLWLSKKYLSTCVGWQFTLTYTVMYAQGKLNMANACEESSTTS